MSEMKLIIENWRQYESREKLLSRSDYITGVLGVQIPLSEDGNTLQSYSPQLIEEILKEQQLIEQWWGGEDVLLESPIGDWWQGTKEKVATYPETMQMLYRATTDSNMLVKFTKAINRRGLRFKQKIIKFIDFLIAKASGIQNVVMQKLAQWATAIKDAIQRAVSWVNSITKPWMKALGLVALSVGLQFAWSKIANFAQEFFRCGGEDEEGPAGAVPETAGSVRDVAKGCFLNVAKKFLKDKAQELFGGALKKLSDEGAAMVTGGVTKFWGWLKAIAKGVEFVVASLAPVLKFFKSRGGLGPENPLGDITQPTPAPT